MAKNVERLQAREAKELIRREIIALFRHRFYFLSGNGAYYFLPSPCGQIRA